MTLRAVADNEPKRLVEGVYTQRQKFYEDLKTFETFGRGWTRRNKETLDSALEMI
jgi:lysozyme family protein